MSLYLITVYSFVHVYLHILTHSPMCLCTYSQLIQLNAVTDLKEVQVQLTKEQVCKHGRVRGILSVRATFCCTNSVEEINIVYTAIVFNCCSTTVDTEIFRGGVKFLFIQNHKN